MPGRWRIVVPGTLPLANAINSQGRGAHMARVHKWREDTRLLALRAGVPRMDRALVIFTRATAWTVEPDDDALPTAFKPVRDGLVDYRHRDRRTGQIVTIPGVLADDGARHMLARYRVGKAATGDAYVCIDVVRIDGVLTADQRLRWEPGGVPAVVQQWALDGDALLLPS